MSRRLIPIAFVFLASPQNTSAQTTGPIDIKALIEKSERAIALDGEGCPKHPDTDEIIVCGTSKDNREQRIFKEQGDADEDRIRPGEAVSTKRAAACVAGPSDCPVWLPATVGMGFGYVPPYPPLYEEVMEGLPDAENVVSEGSVDSDGRPIAPNPNPNPNP